MLNLITSFIILYTFKCWRIIWDASIKITSLPSSRCSKGLWRSCIQVFDHLCSTVSFYVKYASNAISIIDIILYIKYLTSWLVAVYGVFCSSICWYKIIMYTQNTWIEIIKHTDCCSSKRIQFRLIWFGIERLLLCQLVRSGRLKGRQLARFYNDQRVASDSIKGILRIRELVFSLVTQTYYEYASFVQNILQDKFKNKSFLASCVEYYLCTSVLLTIS